jgi:hypothetical protein
VPVNFGTHQKKRNGNRNRVGLEGLGLPVTSKLIMKKHGGLPAVSVTGMSATTVKLDRSSLACCGSQVAFGTAVRAWLSVAEPEIPGPRVVVIKM